MGLYDPDGATLIFVILLSTSLTPAGIHISLKSHIETVVSGAKIARGFEFIVTVALKEQLSFPQAFSTAIFRFFTTEQFV